MKNIRNAALAAAFIAAMSVCGTSAFALDAGTEEFLGEITVNDGKTYCLDSDGENMTGWIKNSEGKSYYFRKSGELAENITLLLDGRFYRFGDGGEVLYGDPAQGSADTTFRPPVIGETYREIYDRCGVVYWRKAVPRTDEYAFNAHTFINGRKCPMTLEFDRTGHLSAWYIDIPADKDEQKIIFNWLVSFWGENYETDDNNVYYWYYTVGDDLRGVAASFESDKLSVSTIAFDE